MIHHTLSPVEVMQYKSDAYDTSRVTRQTHLGISAAEKRNYVGIIDDRELPQYPWLRQQCEGAIDYLGDEELLGRLVRLSSMSSDYTPDVVSFSGGKYLLSEPCPYQLRYFQDPHCDWSVTKANAAHWIREQLTPFSVITALEPQGFWLRFWPNTIRGGVKRPMEYVDVYTPCGSSIVFRGDMYHCGLGYQFQNRRHFKYAGVRTFAGGAKHYANAVRIDEEFIMQCRAIIPYTPPR